MSTQYLFSSPKQNLGDKALNSSQPLSQYFLVLIGSVDVDPFSSNPFDVITSAVNKLCEKTIIVHTVLMNICPDKITYATKSSCSSFPSNLTECVVLHKENRQLFGVIQREKSGQTKCYVFGADEQLIFHSVHAKYTSRHKITCTPSYKRGENYGSFCDQFPHCARPVLDSMEFMRNAPKILIPERVCYTHLALNDSKISAFTVETDDSIYSVTRRFNNNGIYKAKSSTLNYIRRSPIVDSDIVEKQKSVSNIQNYVKKDSITDLKPGMLELHRLNNIRIPRLNSKIRNEKNNSLKMQSVNVSVRHTLRNYGTTGLLRQHSQSHRLNKWHQQRQSETSILNNEACGVYNDHHLPSFEEIFTNSELRSSFRKSMDRLANDIYKKFFAPESKEQVNIDNEVLKVIENAISSNQISSDLYLSAQKQVRSMLRFDCWPRYIAKIKEAPLTTNQKQHHSLLHGWKERFLRLKKSGSPDGLIIRPKSGRKDPLLRRSKSFSVVLHWR
uniref:RGS domain-containing protein n=1 Tax=Syphacia muris TaxID=451379 RepID=A0A0N5AFA7_9BILA